MGEKMSQEIALREHILRVDVPLTPISKRDIQQLETALIIGSLYRPDVIERIIHREEEFLTWVDSLVVAAKALARSKAGYPVSKIAEELGRSEHTIRRHLNGETNAGKIVIETYNLLKKGEIKVNIPVPKGMVLETELEKVKNKYQKKIEELESKVNSMENEIRELREKISKVKEYLSNIKELINNIEKIL